MPLNNDSVVLSKGFYTSTKSPIIEKHGNIYGNYGLSFDYVLSDGITKQILTVRMFVSRIQLETLLDNLFDKYGNYHLNYLIFMSSVFFDDKAAEIYMREINKSIMKFNNNILPKHVPFDKNTLYDEFHTIKRIWKTKQFTGINAQMLFVNDNIYTSYVYTGMNKNLE